MSNVIELFGVTKDQDGNPKMQGIFYEENTGGVESSGNEHTLYGIENGEAVSGIVLYGCDIPVISFSSEVICA